MWFYIIIGKQEITMTISREELKVAMSSVAKTDKKALAELIVSYVDPKHITLDIAGMFLNTRALKPGDAIVKKVRRGIEVRQFVPGQTTLSSQITLKDVVNYNIDQHYVQVSHNLWEIESGEIGSVESIRAEMKAKLNDFFQTRIMTALYTLASIDDDTNFYYMTAPITRTVLESAIDKINDEAGGVKAVVGRRTALAPVTKFAGYRQAVGSTESTAPMVAVNSVLEEIQRTGWVGTYYGTTFMALPQIYDNPYDRNELIRDDLVVVVGDKLGEFITYGEPKEDQWTEMSTAPPTWYIRTYVQHGMILDALENAVIIRLDHT
jgi:hypothetical protein